MLNKPRNILHLEEKLQITIDKTDSSENILGNSEKNIYFEEQGKVLGLSILSERLQVNVDCLIEFPDLLYLVLSNNNLIEIPRLSSSTNLTKVNISRNQITKIVGLENLENLRELNIASNAIEKIEGLEELINLEVLNLRENHITNIPEFFPCLNLKEIDLSKNKINSISGLNYLVKLEKLHLENNGIVEITGLFNLLNLNLLDLSFNKILKIEGLGSLSNLLTLDLAHNEITKIQGLENLGLLEWLNLERNKIEVIQNLESLLNLEMLILYDCNIKKINNLHHLEKLRGLYLWNNQLEKIESLDTLQNLEELYLQGNKIKKIENIENLTNLRELSLGYNQISKIEGLQKQVNLTHLYLTDNEIIKIEGLEALSRLEFLKLSDNRISKIEGLEVLESLKEIYLDNNNITDLSDFSSFKDLEKIALSKNMINDLSPLKSLLENKWNVKELVYIFDHNAISIDGNPLSKPPMEVVLQGNDKILEWFEEAEKYGTEPLYDAKLLIIGEPKHGKSSLRKKLLDPNYQIPDDCLTETVGVEIYPDYIVSVESHLKEINTKIWDFGGQERQYYLHQYFLRKNAVYILVSDDRKDNQNFDYWMSKLKLFTGGNSEIIILFNQIQRTSQSTSFSEEHYKKLGFSFKHFHLDLSKDRERFFELKAYIDESLGKLPYIGQEYPKYCNRISLLIDELKIKEGKNYITIQEFEKICKSIDFNNSRIIQKALEYLDLSGKIIYYEDDYLRHLIILNPHWLIDAIYGIITSRELEDMKGRFKKTWLYKYLGEDRGSPNGLYSTSEIDNILLLMHKNHYDICYTLNNQDYLVPLLMPEVLPECNIDLTSGLQIFFRYEIMPKGLIPRVLVRLSQYIFDNLICRNEGVLSKDGTFAIIEEYFERNDANRFIRIIVKGNSQVEFLQEIRNEVTKVQKSWFENLEPQELIPCNCEICKSSKNPYKFNKTDLLKRIQKKKFEVECNESLESIEIYSLLGVIYGIENIKDYVDQEIAKLNLDTSINIDFGDKFTFGEKSKFGGSQFGGKGNKQNS